MNKTPASDSNRELASDFANEAEAQAIEQFMDRLMQLARSRLPAKLKPRVDPEDIVQSVFNSFLKRTRENKFDIESSTDLWRILAAMTYHKTMSAVEYHSRKRRDYKREANGQNEPGKNTDTWSDEATASAIAIMTELLEKILERMPKKHQEILRLRLEEFTIEEIAERLQVSTRTVNRAIHSARRIAAKLVERNGES